MEIVDIFSKYHKKYKKIKQDKIFNTLVNHCKQTEYVCLKEAYKLKLDTIAKIESELDIDYLLQFGVIFRDMQQLISEKMIETKNLDKIYFCASNFNNEDAKKYMAENGTLLQNLNLIKNQTFLKENIETVIKNSKTDLSFNNVFIFAEKGYITFEELEEHIVNSQVPQANYISVLTKIDADILYNYYYVENNGKITKNIKPYLNWAINQRIENPQIPFEKLIEKNIANLKQSDDGLYGVYYHSLLKRREDEQYKSKLIKEYNKFTKSNLKFEEKNRQM